jgi:class 3 adenylate cyclase
MNVAQWLNAIDLGQYEAVFREHEIDAGVLRDLVEADLEKIGVPLGHRKRLLKAIAALGTAETPAKPPSPAPASSLATAERRPITVMFCDLVGSTSMAAKLDAEDWRTLVNAYLDEASAAVAGLGGHVLKKLGDGLMALFGYPHAQENDAERAVRAALAIQRALVEINARNASRGVPELQARIGLDSGQVVVDATGEVFGDAPNIAARVQSAAGPGSILITATVQRQTAGLFVAEDRGQHELKGMSAPATLYRVIRASGGGRRSGARALTPLVGRDEELDLLGRRWDRAQKGEGQLALIVGEPGLGKSRLMEEFHGRLGETPHTWVEWSSSQLLQNTPLHPIAEWGRQRFGVDLPTEQRLADLENTLGLIGLDPTEYAPLLAPLVDVLLPEGRAAKLAPEELRRRQLAAMTAWVLASARIQAVVLAFEDLQWADPTSLDLMRALAERGVQAPLLIIATARPEFRPSWSVRSHHSAISLSPLDRAQIAKMVRELSSRHALPKDIVEGVSERTGGVPLFVEEVTRLLLERGEQGGAQAIPPTLQQSLAARLDRLGSAREIAQIGAVLGRSFSYALLQSVAGLDEGALRSSLERLAEADILFVEGDGAQATYRFKHALIQDAAYDSLLKTRRQALHAQAAEILRESASPEPEAIAHHFTQAGLDDLAIEWWGKAGDQALRRSAFQEAISHLGDRDGGQRGRTDAGVGNGGSVEPEAEVANRLRPSADVVEWLLF